MGWTEHETWFPPNFEILLIIPTIKELAVSPEANRI